MGKESADEPQVFLDGEINPDQPDQRCNACFLEQDPGMRRFAGAILEEHAELLGMDRY